MCVCVCVTGCTGMLGELVTGTKIRSRKRQRGSELSQYLGFQCGHWQMHRQTMVAPMHMHSGFPTRRSEQMIMTS